MKQIVKSIYRTKNIIKNLRKHFHFKMIFEEDNETTFFKQFPHCRFKEGVVRVLQVPLGKPPEQLLSVILCVTKLGRVGLYSSSGGSKEMTLLHTFILDMEEGDHAPCRRYHIIKDALLLEDFSTVVFATSKGILQCYDTGTLEGSDLGLRLLPRREFLQLSEKTPPTASLANNHGFSQTHCISLEDFFISCASYHSHGKDKETPSLLLLGDMEGRVKVISMGDTSGSNYSKHPFGWRKVLGKTAELREKDIPLNIMTYQAHSSSVPVRDLLFLPSRNLILSCGREGRASVFAFDWTGLGDPIRIPLSQHERGTTCLALSQKGGLIFAGSGSGKVRVFSQYRLHTREPERELAGHKAAVAGLEVLGIPFSEEEVLLSFAEDMELRAWDPVKGLCMQRLYVRFPSPHLSATIISKFPSFPKHPILLLTYPEDRRNASLILLYSNAFAILDFERNEYHWPFNFEELSLDGKIAKAPPTSSRERRKLEKVSLNIDEERKVEKKTRESVEKVMELKYGHKKKQGEEIEREGIGKIFKMRSALLEDDVHHGIPSYLRTFAKLPLFEDLEEIKRRPPPIPYFQPSGVYLQGDLGGLDSQGTPSIDQKSIDA